MNKGLTGAPAFSRSVARIRILILGLGSMLVSCNQPFDPRGQLDQRLVVYSILSTDRTQQFVRVEQSYMPSDYDALSFTGDVSVVGASVVLRSTAGSFVLHDTAFPRGDTSRYAFPLNGYVINSFKVDYGKSYSISVKAGQSTTVAGTVLVPFKPGLSLNPSSYIVLDDPLHSASDANILFPIVCGTNAKAFIGRLFVYYDVLRDGIWTEERTEIPVGYKFSGTNDLKYAAYGSLTSRSSNGFATALYKNALYNQMLAEVAYIRNTGLKIVFNRVVFVLLQLDPNLYNYYLTAHANNDPHSIRLDEPSYSNIPKGQGVVGAYTLDSLIHVLPEGFGYDKY